MHWSPVGPSGRTLPALEPWHSAPYYDCLIQWVEQADSLVESENYSWNNWRAIGASLEYWVLENKIFRNNNTNGTCCCWFFCK